MKRLYLRLFESKDNTVPTDSIQMLSHDWSTDMDIAEDVKRQIDVIGDWMMRHPEGKTDFVWLSC